MVYGVLRMINFANSEIFMVGTFATVVVTRDFLGHPANGKDPVSYTHLTLPTNREV